MPLYPVAHRYDIDAFLRPVAEGRNIEGVDAGTDPVVVAHNNETAANPGINTKYRELTAA